MLWILFYLCLAVWVAAIFSTYLFGGWIHLLLVAATLVLVTSMFRRPNSFG